MQIEYLSDETKANGQFIIRKYENHSGCYLRLPNKIPNNTYHDGDYATNYALVVNKKIKIFQLNKQIYNKQFMIKSYDFENTVQNFEIQQEFYSKTLYSIKPANLTYVQKLKIVQKIAGILNYIHSENVCVRSLKPERLSFQQNQYNLEVKLIWLSEPVKLANSKEMITENIPEISDFTAPQIRLRRSYGLSADVWSLGAIFYYLLFGSLDLITLDENQLQVNYPQGTPKWLCQIFNNLLDENPNHRCRPSAALSHFKSMLCCAESAEKYLPKWGMDN